MIQSKCDCVVAANLRALTWEAWYFGSLNGWMYGAAANVAESMSGDRSLHPKTLHLLRRSVAHVSHSSLRRRYHSCCLPARISAVHFSVKARHAAFPQAIFSHLVATSLHVALANRARNYRSQHLGCHVSRLEVRGSKTRLCIGALM